MATPPATGTSAAPGAPVGDRAAGVRTRNRRELILGTAVVVVAADQVSKTWALHHTLEPIHVLGSLRLALTFNAGTAFGLVRGITPVVVAAAIILVVVLLGLGRTASRTASMPAALAMGLMLGGACGNLADRLIRHNHGAVIDFVDLRWWPVFNLADAGITVGAVVLVLVGAARRTTHGEEAGAAGSAPGPGSDAAQSSHDPGADMPDG